MRNIDDLRKMATANRNEITTVFAMAGLADISSRVLDAIAAGDVTEVTVSPDTYLQWMAFKRRGTPDLLRNVRWAGRTSFDAFQVRLNSGGFTYTIVIPKVCGNLSLASRTAIPVTTTAEAPPPAPLSPPLQPALPPPVESTPASPPPPPVGPQDTTPVVFGPTKNTWMASGFVGSNFSTNIDNVNLRDEGDPTVEFGGQFAYLWRGIVGGEALVDFAPNVEMDRLFDNGLFFDQDHNINAYMANAIGAFPLGADGRYQPYISGGFGAIQFKGDVFDIDGFSSSQRHSQFGGNIGAGLLVFAGHFGVRGDIRYFRASSDNEISDTTIPEELTRRLLSGLGLWRANGGLAVRW